MERTYKADACIKLYHELKGELEKYPDMKDCSCGLTTEFRGEKCAYLKSKRKSHSTGSTFIVILSQYIREGLEGEYMDPEPAHIVVELWKNENGSNSTLHEEQYNDLASAMDAFVALRKFLRH